MGRGLPTRLLSRHAHADQPDLGSDYRPGRVASLPAERNPRRLALTGVDALTRAERRVADLAAQGLTNRQIALALFVSLPTVETHVRHVLRKLDITSRKLAEHLGPGEGVGGRWGEAWVSLLLARHFRRRVGDG